jgi:hypothetical protein
MANMHTDNWKFTVIEKESSPPPQKQGKYKTVYPAMNKL